MHERPKASIKTLRSIYAANSRALSGGALSLPLRSSARTALRTHYFFTEGGAIELDEDFEGEDDEGVEVEGEEDEADEDVDGDEDETDDEYEEDEDEDEDEEEGADEEEDELGSGAFIRKSFSEFPCAFRRDSTTLILRLSCGNAVSTTISLPIAVPMTLMPLYTASNWLLPLDIHLRG